jgi:hypothetical protein
VGFQEDARLGESLQRTLSAWLEKGRYQRGSTGHGPKYIGSKNAALARGRVWHESGVWCSVYRIATRNAAGGFAINGVMLFSFFGRTIEGARSKVRLPFKA